MQSIMDQLRSWWNTLTPRNRTLAAGGLAVFVGLMVVVSIWAARPEYHVLYASLEPEDAGMITERLRGQNVEYKLTDSGRTILVPARDVHQVRLDMAHEGLPSSGTGYELLDTSKLGWTDFVQKVQYRRALEGEISRTVQTLREIQTARVHLVTPEPSLFVTDEKPATASVVLELRGGNRLSAPHVQGIVHLVSSAVEGLDPENVTVLDSQGNLLSNPASSTLAGVTSEQMGVVRDMEEVLTRKVETLLDTVLGRGKAAVRIAVEMDFEQSEMMVESYDADNPVVRSEHRSESTGTDGSTTESGTTNFEISKRTERKTAPAGNVKRLTASVFVDGTYTGEESGNPVYAPRTPDEMTKFENIIKTAIGFSAERGDQLTVENIAFENTGDELLVPVGGGPGRFQEMSDLIGRGLVMLLAVGIAIYVFRLSRKLTAPQVAAVELDPAAAARAEAAAALSASERLRESVVDLGRDNPEEVSRLIRAWLKEDAA